jgi:hypothetical protein
VCVSLRNGDPRAPQCAANVRVAKGREWARRLVPALAVACLAITLVAQVALADTAGVTVNPTSGLPTAAFTVDGTYTWTAGCPALAPVPLTFVFYFDNNPNAPIGSPMTTSTCVKNVTDSGPSKPWTPPAALAKVGSHTVVVNIYDATGKQINTAGAVYTITAPPPPPTTPPPTTPPPTTPPPTTPPPPTPPPHQTPAHPSADTASDTRPHSNRNPDCGTFASVHHRRPRARLRPG